MGGSPYSLTIAVKGLMLYLDMTLLPNLKHLFAELRERIGSGRGGRPFSTLEQLKLLDIPHSRLLENDLTFFVSSR